MWCYCYLVTKSCLTLCNPLDNSLRDSSASGILLGKNPERVAISFSRGSSQLRDQIHIFCIAGAFFTAEPTGKPQKMCSFLFLTPGFQKWYLSYTLFLYPTCLQAQDDYHITQLYRSALGDRFFPKSLCLLKPIDLIVLLCCRAHQTLTES